MKSFAFGTALAIALLCSHAAVTAEQTVTLKVEGMTCASCPYMVKRSLTRLDGVKRAKVSFETASATVTYDDQKVGPEAFSEATSAAGFPSSVKTE